jgi:hypothetical protein
MSSTETYKFLRDTLLKYILHKFVVGLIWNELQVSLFLV